jgi:hypothetical protein
MFRWNRSDKLVRLGIPHRQVLHAIFLGSVDKKVLLKNNAPVQLYTRLASFGSDSRKVYEPLFFSYLGALMALNLKFEPISSSSYQAQAG